MAKDYITILNRLPEHFPTGRMCNKGWDNEKQCFLIKPEIAYLRIGKRDKKWIIGYYVDDIPFTRILLSSKLEESIDNLLDELSQIVDIHDLLQP